jgi:TPR repeat protein
MQRNAASPRTVRRLALGTAAAVATMLAAWPATTPVAATVRNAEDLLIVDCLLPGQVRKLGRQTTFLSARRPIRTTQADCEIRGGEYVSYDRADYRTALQVWMGQAEAGDAEAQNYVGEIYLKGLGTAPDYGKAAAWFEKAVAQGNKRAMINLGYIHEEGLGTPRDLTRALNLYREASGSKDELLFASTVTAQAEAAKAEIAALRQTVESQKQEAERLRAEIGDLKKQLGERRAALDGNEKELARLRAELVAKQAAITPPGEAEELKRLQAALDARDGELASQREAIEKDRAGFAAQVQSSRLKLAELRVQEAELSDRQDDAARAELARVRGAATDLALQLDEAMAGMEALQAKLAQNEARMAEQQAQFDAERKRMQAAVAGSAQDRDLLLLLEQQLAQKQREVSRQREQIVALERQIGAPGAPGVALASLGAGPLLEIIDPPLSVTRGRQAAMVRGGGTSELLGKVVASAGLTSVEVNGQQVAVGANGLFRVNVPVSTEGSTIQVAAIDRAGSRARLEFTLMPLAAGKASAAPSPGIAQAPRALPRNVKLGRFHALVIGNDDYATYPDLSSAGADARKVAEVLKRRYGFQARVLANATRFDILSALNEYRETLAPEDNLVVYFAGHGEIDARSKEGYWVPVDGRANESATWISNRAISDILTTMQAKHVMVVADSCYSGAMTRASVPAFNSALTDAQWSQWVADRSASRSRTALTSGGLAPVPDAAAGGNSLFAQAFITALEDNNALMPAQRLFREVSLGLATASAEASLPQAPEYAPIQFAGHEAGEFFFQPRG